jgi:hypothetical protein
MSERNVCGVPPNRSVCPIPSKGPGEHRAGSRAASSPDAKARRSRMRRTLFTRPPPFTPPPPRRTERSSRSDERTGRVLRSREPRTVDTNERLRKVVPNTVQMGLCARSVEIACVATVSGPPRLRPAGPRAAAARHPIGVLATPEKLGVISPGEASRPVHHPKPAVRPPATTP